MFFSAHPSSFDMTTLIAFAASGKVRKRDGRRCITIPENVEETENNRFQNVGSANLHVPYVACERGRV
jgi:hypothetical protein